MDKPIGDNLRTDIHGGNLAGMKATVLVKFWDEPPPGCDHIQPTFTVRDVCEVEQILEKLL